MQRTNYNDFRLWHQTGMPTALRNVRFRGQSRKLLLALSFSGFDPFPTSPLRHPGEAHAHAEAFAPSKVSRIVASFGGAHATDGEAWIERKSRRCSGSRLIYSAEQPQGSGQRKMGERIIAVGLNASSVPTRGFGIRAEL
jgi:hypothetical protein